MGHLGADIAIYCDPSRFSHLRIPTFILGVRGKELQRFIPTFDTHHVLSPKTTLICHPEESETAYTHKTHHRKNPSSHHLLINH
jgi:hypothetical protein